MPGKKRRHNESGPDPARQTLEQQEKKQSIETMEYHIG
jgi:hypothetical protein